MANRDFQINGACLVKVWGGEHLQLMNSQVGRSGGDELGLCLGPIHVVPEHYHRDIVPDDFTQRTPANVISTLGACHVHMTLIHYDPDVLGVCVGESRGGVFIRPNGALDPFEFDDGILAPNGTLMGNLGMPTSSGNHFIVLDIEGNFEPNPLPGQPTDAQPWRFPAAYLAEKPMELPLGTRTSAVRLNWRVVPFSRPPVTATTIGLSGSVNTYGDLSSSGAVLWHHDLTQVIPTTF